MAQSPGHKLGQMIGETIQQALEVPIRRVADKYGLYLDGKGKRETRKGIKLTWPDKYGNSHDLDFVLERNGSDKILGEPVAFIEVAWRSYTKHSRNKAQEIHGAIVPLRDTYDILSPFIGVVLAGLFTEAALRQLRSHGFSILFFSHEAVVAAFEKVGVDVNFNEKTSDKALAAKVKALNKLGPAGSVKVGRELLAQHTEQVGSFIQELERKLTKHVQRVLIVALFGETREFASIGAALTNLDEIAAIASSASPMGYEAIIEFDNGDRVSGQFKDIDRLRIFLQRIAVP
jgi:hypothetical protein